MKKLLMILTLLGVVLGTAACTSAVNNGPETKEQQMNRLLHYANEQAKLETQNQQ